MALSVDITENWKLIYLKRNWIPVQWTESYGTVAQFNSPSNIDSVYTMGNERKFALIFFQNII